MVCCVVVCDMMENKCSFCCSTDGGAEVSVSELPPAAAGLKQAQAGAGAAAEDGSGAGAGRPDRLHLSGESSHQTTVCSAAGRFVLNVQ